MPDETSFGFRQVSPGEKTRLVREVFDSVAGKYDLMNDVMSMGVHRLWKRHFVSTAMLRPGEKVLDLAGGTGDITALMHKATDGKASFTIADINDSMLRVGRDRLTDRGLLKDIDYVQCNAEALPFADNQYDCVTMAFGLRNVTFKDKALAEIYRVLKPGGRALILEFSTLSSAKAQKFYDLYSFSLLPKMGKLIADDEESYRYLAESIRKHPDQQTLAKMMRDAGFERVDYRNLSIGVVAIHSGCKA